LIRRAAISPRFKGSAMQMQTQTSSSVVERYRAKTPKSAALYERARLAFPSGLTHDSRVLDPYPLFVERAAGARKWCVDGHEYVDYFGGHGALLLGHCAPDVVAAVQRQAARGTHFGSAHELELRWAELIQKLVPGAQRVRFTASGTEATHLALRLARAFTGKDKVVRFLGHFHGWHDHVAAGSNSHYDGARPIGVLPDIVQATILMPTDDVQPTVSLLEARDDIAAVIVEPSGASWGQVPLPPGFLQALRDTTARRGVILIFDEVITGFRWSRGGAQARYGLTPDICILAKIVAGGLPGGAVAGRADILSQIDAAAAKAAGREKIGHQGTFNANPLCAAAAVATLSIIEREDVCGRAEATAEELRSGMRTILIEEQVPWGVYGEASSFQIFQNPQGMRIDPATFDPAALGFNGLKGAKDANLSHRLRIAMIANGVDIMGAPGGLVSATHGEAEVARTLETFRTAVRWLKAEGDVRG
jgi:glutamate-1-semialdehyde 2,1-aminomutase